ncbi:MAG: NAD(P)H-hydrate epimerase [Planctomycetaceae bacterium]|nr:NAD(P)H-hydrate epimerase [Planctomycetaceae bacterium]
MSSGVPSFVLNCAQARAVDARAVAHYGISGLVLMENAGSGCSQWLRHLGIRGPVVICCGKGNNAGDGFVIARHLDLHGATVRVLLWCPPDVLEGDALVNYRIIERSGITIERADRMSQATVVSWLSEADWIIDALLGTGARGELRAPLDLAVMLMNRAPSRKLAIDAPTGLDCDTGEPGRITFVADYTCTFVAAKAGLVLPQARSYVGELQVIGIGIPRRMLEDLAREQDRNQGRTLVDNGAGE